MTDIRFPKMRAEVFGCIEALADPAYQARVWIDRAYPRANFYDDLDLGDASDATYLADSRWSAIVEAASRAKAAMEAP